MWRVGWYLGSLSLTHGWSIVNDRARWQVLTKSLTEILRSTEGDNRTSKLEHSHVVFEFLSPWINNRRMRTIQEWVRWRCHPLVCKSWSISSRFPAKLCSSNLVPFKWHSIFLWKDFSPTVVPCHENSYRSPKSPDFGLRWKVFILRGELRSWNLCGEIIPLPARPG